MYNLLIAAQDDMWSGTACEFQRSRSVNEYEYTDEDLAKKYKGLGKEAVAALTTIPCVFGYEQGIKKSARIGWLKTVKLRGENVRLEFEFEEGLPAISQAKLKKLAVELDITSGELNRTYWAVKDINLLQVLVRGSVLNEDDLKKRGKDSRLLQLGQTKPISELKVRPSIFRVPAGKVEADLVSVMMPFEAQLSKVFETIKSACKDASLRCQRADNIWNETEVIQDVFSLIYRSRRSLIRRSIDPRF